MANKKSIDVKVNEKSGLKYITIYEVRGKELKTGNSITLDRFLNKKDAEKYQKFCYDVHHELYYPFWIMEQMVWI